MTKQGAHALDRVGSAELTSRLALQFLGGRTLNLLVAPTNSRQPPDAALDIHSVRQYPGVRSERRAEDEAPHLIAQLFYFFGISSNSKAFRESEEGLLFFLLRFDALLNQFDQYAVVAEAPLSGDAFDLFCQARGKGYASSNLLAGCHNTNIHQFGAFQRSR